MTPTVETTFFAQETFFAIVLACSVFCLLFILWGLYAQCANVIKIRQTQEEQIEVAIATMEEGIVVKGRHNTDDDQVSKKKQDGVYHSDVQAVLLLT
jgi:hypothetical protein